MLTVVELLLESMWNGGVAVLLLVIHVLERSCCLLAGEMKGSNFFYSKEKLPAGLFVIARVC